MAKDDLEDERIRAEDVLLGSHGFGEDARLVALSVSQAGYRGIGQWSDGSQFEFESDDLVSEIERWAVEVLQEFFK
jgi:hypothetical protein